MERKKKFASYIECMKLLQAPNLKTIALTKGMHTMIRRYVDETFSDTSEESEESEKKKNIF